MSERPAPRPFSSAPADCVSYAERRVQIRKVSTLPRPELLSYMQDTPVLARPVQHRLQAHPHVRVRQVLAEHPHLVSEVQRLLAEDVNPYVRRTLAKHSQLDAAAARSLYLSRQGAEHLGSWPYIVGDLAQNSSAPLDLLWEIYRAAPAAPAFNAARRRALCLLANPAFPLEPFGPVEELDNHQQFVLAKRPGLELAVLRRLRAGNVYASVVRRLAPERAELVLSLQPHWEGTFGELLDAVELDLETLSPAAREAALKLFPDWGGDWHSLMRAATALTG